MRKCVWVVWVNNYYPKVCGLTINLLYKYAVNIGADFRLITERKFPEFPPNFEKFQVHELGLKYDYNILIDADFVVHPELEDVSQNVPLTHFGAFMFYGAHFYFKDLDYAFLRDERDLAVVTNFVVTTRLTHDAWKPPKEPAALLSKMVHNKWCLDEFVFSRNVAKYGLKHCGIFTQEPAAFEHLELTAARKEGRDEFAYAKSVIERILSVQN